jgi:hypothetical protein
MLLDLQLAFRGLANQRERRRVRLAGLSVHGF